MRHTLLFCLFSIVMVNCSFGQKPTKTDIVKSVKSLFEKSGNAEGNG